MNLSHDLGELIASIIELRTMISTELNQISNWFTRSKISNTPDYKLSFLVDLAKVMIDNNFPDTDISLKKTINTGNLTLQGKTLKNLSAILFILLSNAIKHGKLSSYNIEIVIRALSSEKIEISITNNTQNCKNHKELSENLNKKINELSKSVESSIIKKEGGSGFYKIAKILRNDLNTNYQFNANYIDKNTFNTLLTFNIENLKT
jgi:hypothetical protein